MTLILIARIIRVILTEVVVISIIAVSNNKGGVLKTSIVTNLAGSLANNGKRVLIIDMDHQGNALLSFGRNPDAYSTTVYDVLTGHMDVLDAIEGVYSSDDENGHIDVLISNDDMIGFDFEVIGNPGNYPEPFYLLREQLRELPDKYDHVLIDTSPSMSLSVANVFSYPGVGVLVPMQCEQYSRRSLVKTLETIEDFRTNHNPELQTLGILPTLVDTRTSLHSEVLQDVRRYGDQLGVKVYDTVIPKTVRYAASVAYNELPATLTESPGNKVRAVYDNLAKELGLIGK